MDAGEEPIPADFGQKGNQVANLYSATIKVNNHSHLHSDLWTS